MKIAVGLVILLMAQNSFSNTAELLKSAVIKKVDCIEDVYKNSSGDLKYYLRGSIKFEIAGKYQEVYVARVYGSAYYVHHSSEANTCRSLATKLNETVDLMLLRAENDSRVQVQGYFSPTTNVGTISAEIWRRED